MRLLYPAEQVKLLHGGRVGSAVVVVVVVSVVVVSVVVVLVVVGPTTGAAMVCTVTTIGTPCAWATLEISHVMLAGVTAAI